jgi:hypothetical protein
MEAKNFFLAHKRILSYFFGGIQSHGIFELFLEKTIFPPFINISIGIDEDLKPQIRENIDIGEPLII